VSVDLRTTSVADMLVALARGEEWAWRVARNIAETGARLARQPYTPRHTPPPGPRLPTAAE
jgi:plasmid stabilization system protein ParE